MSMFIVGKDHIDLMITAALAWGLAAPERADAIGRMLWAENLASAKYRYPNSRDGERPGPIEFRDSDVDTYTFEPIHGLVDPQVVAQACACYDDQASQHQGWATSGARTWSGALHVVADQRLPEFEQRYGAMTEQAVRALSPGQRDWTLIFILGEPVQVSCSGAWSVTDRELFLRVEQQRAESKAARS